MHERAETGRVQEEVKEEFSLARELDKVDKEILLVGKNKGAYDSPTIFRQQRTSHDTPSTQCVMSGDKYQQYRS